MIRWLLLFTAIAAAAWWFTTPNSAPQSHATIACTPPLGTVSTAAPLQSPLPQTMPAFSINGAQLQPLAGFNINARVLSRKHYRTGREADFSPIDLALGWGRMRDDDVLSKLSIEQSGRWYHYRWEGHPPIPPTEMARSSANMHMIPSSDAVAAALDTIKGGDHVRIDGWLVQVNASDGWHWRSSLTRDDTGAGACEVIYVCSIRQTTR